MRAQTDDAPPRLRERFGCWAGFRDRVVLHERKSTARDVQIEYGVQEEDLTKKLSHTADRLDTGADWRVLALTQANHRSRLSDSVESGNALSSVQVTGD